MKRKGGLYILLIDAKQNQTRTNVGSLSNCVETGTARGIAVTNTTVWLKPEPDGKAIGYGLAMTDYTRD